MPAITASEFRASFPEFSESGYPDLLVERWIGVARRIHDLSTDGVGFVTAHLLALDRQDTSTPDGGRGEVTGESLGPKSLQYRTQADSGREVFFTRTSYGRLFLTLEKRTPARVISARIIG